MKSCIRKLKITHFRGIECLTWLPDPGINIILGGGDTGKTTILDAIALLFHPTNTYTLADIDYWRRDIQDGFSIEAVVSLPDDVLINRQYTMNWPWRWNGKEATVEPDDDSEESRNKSRDTVYVVRAQATPDLELNYEVVQPNGEVSPFSVGLRRNIGLIRLVGDDRNDRDLRLVSGSALDRLLDDKAFRSRLGADLAIDDIKRHLKPEPKASLSSLGQKFADRGLPTNLGLGVIGSYGFSLNALVGLTAEKTEGVSLPLSSWGTGTRRFASQTIADTLQGERPITVVDEFERGLEPYRQRKLMSTLRTSAAQVFLTTHSATAISAGRDAALWYLDSKGHLGRLKGSKIVQHQESDPEIFLARLTVVCEGATEIGFCESILGRALDLSLEDYGIKLTDGGGNDDACTLLVALSKARLTFAGVVDDEKRSAGRWARIKEGIGDLLLQWEAGSIEQQIIPLFDFERIPQLIEDPEGELTRRRLRSLAERLELDDIEKGDIMQMDEERVFQVIIEAATGSVPSELVDDKRTKKHWQSHGKDWFKSVQGGRELADKMFSLGAWPKLESKVLPFLNAVRSTVGQNQMSEVPSE